MNESDRRFFLKRFFSFNNSSTASNTTSSICNGSFEEDQEIAPINFHQSIKPSIGMLPSITVESIENKTTKDNIDLEIVKSVSSSPGPVSIRSIEDLNEMEPSTPSSSAPLILTRMNAFEIETSKTLLQQQNSIELKPFRKKEVLIMEEPKSMFSSLTPEETQNATLNQAATITLIPESKTEKLPLIENSLKYNDKNMDGSEKVSVTSHHEAIMNIHTMPVFKDQPQFLNLKYRNLGKSGLRVSQFGLGTWVTFGAQISDDIAEEILTTAYLNGINLFETGEVYAGGKAELALGRILKKKNWRRSSYIVCTKIYSGGKAETEKGLSRKHIIEGVNASLQRLQLDYVDIVFANKPDSNMPMEEIVRAFTHLINTDKTFYWGTSRWNSMEIMEAYSVARQFNLIPPICEQAEYNMFQREEVEMNLPDVYARIGIGTMTWSPLACGILSGKYEDGIPTHSRAALKGYGWLKDKIISDEGTKKLNKIKELQQMAEKLNCTMAQLAIAWCLKNETVHSVLLGASSVDQLVENIQSLLIVPKLNHTILNEIDRILCNKPTISRHASKSENLQKA